MHEAATDPDVDCSHCSRLAEFRNQYRLSNPEWHNAPVPSWFPSSSHGGTDAVKILIVGLAPGLKGANRTGRPFTGDFAGDLLYDTLVKFDLAKGRYAADSSDTLKLVSCGITNAVRCVPPQNKPVGAEINQCRPYLINTLDALPNLKVLITLGKISHDSTARALETRVAAVPFGHNIVHSMGGYSVVSSYHCSRYNTNTGRLTDQMFHDVFETAKSILKSG